MARSRAGLGLALVPVRLWVILLAAFTLALQLPGAAAPIAGLTVTAVWARWSITALTRRARETDAWLRERVQALGGDGNAPQPVRAPTTYEVNARNAPAPLTSAESTRLEFMRDPGGTSSRALAVAGLAVSGSALTLIAVVDQGTATRVLSLPPAALALTALCDLYRGRLRRWPRLHRTAPAPWPPAWTIIDPPSKMLGPIWLGLVLTIGLISILVTRADSLSRGITLASLALGATAGLWTQRSHFGGLAAIERTALHRWVSRALVAIAPAVWETVRAFQVTLVALGVIACSLFLIDYYALYLGLLLIGIALIVRALRKAWQRPRDPELIGFDYVATLFGEPHLKQRMTTVAGFVGPVTFIALFIAQVVWH